MIRLQLLQPETTSSRTLVVAKSHHSQGEFVVVGREKGLWHIEEVGQVSRSSVQVGLTWKQEYVRANHILTVDTVDVAHLKIQESKLFNAPVSI